MVFLPSQPKSSPGLGMECGWDLRSLASTFQGHARGGLQEGVEGSIGRKVPITVCLILSQERPSPTISPTRGRREMYLYGGSPSMRWLRGTVQGREAFLIWGSRSIEPLDRPPHREESSEKATIVLGYEPRTWKSCLSNRGGFHLSSAIPTAPLTSTSVPSI